MSCWLSIGCMFIDAMMLTAAFFFFFCFFTLIQSHTRSQSAFGCFRSLGTFVAFHFGSDTKKKKNNNSYLTMVTAACVRQLWPNTHASRVWLRVCVRARTRLFAPVVDYSKIRTKRFRRSPDSSNKNYVYIQNTLCVVLCSTTTVLYVYIFSALIYKLIWEMHTTIDLSTKREK